MFYINGLKLYLVKFLEMTVKEFLQTIKILVLKKYKLNIHYIKCITGGRKNWKY